MAGGGGTVSSSSSQQVDASKWNCFSVYLDLSKIGLGMTIRGGNDCPDPYGHADIFVSRILAGGAVHQDGRIQIGMYLCEQKEKIKLSINTQSFR